jgi:response regulator RpfG family c-di-GMP phosphodiesterase
LSGPTQRIAPRRTLDSVLCERRAGQMVVEDKKDRKLVRDLLQFKGYRTIEAETGEAKATLAIAHNGTIEHSAGELR